MVYNFHKKEFFLTADTFLKYENKIWFPELDCNELYCYDLNDDSVKLVCKIDSEAEYQHRLFGGLAAINQKIYMLPFSAERMYEVDILTGDVKSIEIRTPDKEVYAQYNKNAKFISGFNFGNYIYLVGSSYPAIVEYDSFTGTINYYDDWVKDLCKYARNDRKAFFRKAIIIENRIYAPTCMGNCVLEFDVKTKRHRIFFVGSEKCSYSSICRVDEWMWLAPQGEGPVVKWNMHTGQWKEYWDFPDTYKPCLASFGDILCFEEYVYCIPLNANMLIRIAIHGESIEEYKLKKFELTNLSLFHLDHKLYLFSQRYNQFIIFKDDKKYELKGLLMPDCQKKYHLKHFSYVAEIFARRNSIKEEEIVYEQFSSELKDYIQCILNLGSAEEKRLLKYLNGYSIYEACICRK